MESIMRFAGAISQFLLMVILLSPPLFAQTAWEKIQGQINEAKEKTKKAQETLETNPPRIEVSVVVDDVEISDQEIFEFELFVGKERQVPISQQGRTFVFNRWAGDQCIFINYKNYLAFTEKPAYDVLKTGAVIVFQIFTNKSLLWSEKHIPTPLAFDENYDRICTRYEGRWFLRNFFLKMPEIVFKRINRLYILTISPKTEAYEGVNGSTIWRD